MAEDNQPPQGSVEPYTGGQTGGGLGAFSVLKDVEVEITLEIGRKRMKIGEVLRLNAGQTIELNKAAGEPIDIYVNGQILGRGEAVVVGDRYGVRITELLSPEQLSNQL